MSNFKKQFSLWYWFFCGTGAGAGFRRLLNAWLLLHLIIAVALSFFVPLNLKDAATRVLLPLVGLLVGLTFAWLGNAHALLQTSEMKALSSYHKGGFAEYVNVYQFSVLIVLATVMIWGLAGLEVYDRVWPTETRHVLYFAMKAFLYLFISISIREAWTVVMGARNMLLTRKEIQDHIDKARES